MQSNFEIAATLLPSVSTSICKDLAYSVVVCMCPLSLPQQFLSAYALHILRNTWGFYASYFTGLDHILSGRCPCFLSTFLKNLHKLSKF